MYFSKSKKYLTIAAMLNNISRNWIRGAALILIFFRSALPGHLPNAGTMYDFHDSTDIFLNPSFLPFCTQGTLN